MTINPARTFSKLNVESSLGKYNTLLDQVCVEIIQ